MMAEMASRISSLEKSLAKATAAGGRETGQSSPKSPVPNMKSIASSAQLLQDMQPGSLSERSREDVVVQKGSSTQYFNEILLSRVIEEVMRSTHVGNRFTRFCVSDRYHRNEISSLS